MNGIRHYFSAPIRCSISLMSCKPSLIPEFMNSGRFRQFRVQLFGQKLKFCHGFISIWRVHLFFSQLTCVAGKQNARKEVNFYALRNSTPFYRAKRGPKRCSVQRVLRKQCIYPRPGLPVEKYGVGRALMSSNVLNCSPADSTVAYDRPRCDETMPGLLYGQILEVVRR